MEYCIFISKKVLYVKLYIKEEFLWNSILYLTSTGNLGSSS